VTARLAVVVGLLLAVVLAGVALLAARPPDLLLEGLPKGELNAADLARTVVTVRTDRPGRLLLDGRELDHGDGGQLSAALAGLADGRHVLVVEVDRGALPGTTTARRVLRVDTTPPVVRVDGARGTASDVLHLSTPEGRDVEVAADGSFTVPAGATALVAFDDAGNRTDVPLPTGR
jgi:hypothetical protein